MNTKPHQPFLDLRDVAITLGARQVIAPVSLDLGRGRLVALVGPNGAGKTSLLRAIAALIPSSGAMFLDGADIGMMQASQRARRVAYLPQGHQIHWPLAVRDVVGLGRFPHGGREPSRLGSEDIEIIQMAMSRTDTLALADRSVQTLSGGERARVMMARVLAVNAAVILADEPTAALDPRHQLAIMAVLKAEAARGTLVIAVTHDLILAARFADEVIVLDQGHIAARGSPDSALNATILKGVYGIEAARFVIDDQAFLVPWSAS
jgi:iron complex transport system ATP-binding protein